MRIKDGCEFSIIDHNKRRILSVVVILSIVALLLTPVSLALTLSESDQEKTADQEKIADQSVNTDKKEPTVAENDNKEPVKDASPNKTPEGSSNDAKNRFISIITELYSINEETELNIDSCYKHNFTIPDDLEVGDILIWDAGHSCNQGIFRFIPDIFSGHCAIYIGPHKEGNCVEAVPHGVGYNNITKYNYEGEHSFAVGRVKNANDFQKNAAVNWTLGRVNRSYQKFWLPWIGPIKSSIPEGLIPPGDPNIRVDDNWYCSELVWAAYYNTSSGTIDIDKDGWGNTHPFLVPSVSPLEINDSENVDIVYSWPDGNGTTTVSLSVDSNSNSNALIYSDSEDNALNYLNYGSNNNTLTNPSSSLNANTLISNLLNKNS